LFQALRERHLFSEVVRGERPEIPMTDRFSPLRDIADTLPDAVRAELADRWTRAALEEHASIASFSRFSLQLMAAGAPPDFLEGAHQAALDEIRHAKLCFDLAEVYANEALAPGPLDLDGDLMGSTDLASLAAAAVVEGCIGETVAALVARHAADGAEYDLVRNVLQLIAKDEEHHAGLAWRFVGWALTQGGEDVHSRVRDAFDRALNVSLGAEPEVLPTDALLAAHGKLGSAAHYRVRREAAEEILRPTAQALLAAV
jgi:hypothetical protein